jgi:hypothetical protein
LSTILDPSLALLLQRANILDSTFREIYAREHRQAVLRDAAADLLACGVPDAHRRWLAVRAYIDALRAQTAQETDKAYQRLEVLALAQSCFRARKGAFAATAEDLENGALRVAERLSRGR